MNELLTYWPFLIAIVGVTVWLIRLEGKIMLAMQKLQFHDELIVKLQMDNRKQFEGLSSSLGIFARSTQELAESVAELKGIISEMRNR
jgi:O-succinylbenzoate synthase